ncbi:MAG: hypothetical protein K2Y21_12785 [Phycisphaerales bacterium]|nr:hypothetical protein [Phycisphaerales bacterium]
MNAGRRKTPRLTSLRGSLGSTVSTLVAGLLACSLAGCETRYVRYNPALANLPGAKTGIQPVYGDDLAVLATPMDKNATDKPVIENPDGTKTLVSRNARDLMYHIATTMREDDEKTFTEQVLSEASRDEFFQRGLDPAWAFKELKRRRADVEKVFKDLPQGDLTPGVRIEVVGQNVFRIRSHYRDVQEYPWVGFDMKLEGSNWKLRWFVPNDGK